MLAFGIVGGFGQRLKIINGHAAGVVQSRIIAPPIFMVDFNFGDIQNYTSLCLEALAYPAWNRLLNCQLLMPLQLNRGYLATRFVPADVVLPGERAIVSTPGAAIAQPQPFILANEFINADFSAEAKRIGLSQLQEERRHRTPSWCPVARGAHERRSRTCST